MRTSRDSSRHRRWVTTASHRRSATLSSELDRVPCTTPSSGAEGAQYHDLVSRPRWRHFHSYGGCGWHHSEFHNGPARILYWWRVNRLLREAGIEYELAAEGEDLGHLVAVTDDARSELVRRALHDSPPDVTAGVRHAIALFRGRDASSDSKRSAIFNLGRILEERRALVKDQLGKDEGTLFEIANRFDLRHRRADQRGDYDEAFLDWIFWW